MSEENCILTLLPLEIVEQEDLDKLMPAILPPEEGEDSGSKAEGQDML